MHTMTLSPSSIMLKSVMAWPARRCRRFESLLISKSAFSAALESITALMSEVLLEPEHFAAHRLAVGIHVGFFGGHARGLHERVREHQREHLVAQGLLQVH